MTPAAPVFWKHWLHLVAFFGQGGIVPPSPVQPSKVPVQSVINGPHFGKAPDEVWIALVEMRLSAKPIRLADERDAPAPQALGRVSA